VSKTVVPYPVVAALVAAERFLGPDRQWRPTNRRPIDEQQKRFLEQFFRICRADRIPEIKSFASASIEEVNRFLADNGFSIQLSPLPWGSFGAASILDLLIEWIEKGEKTEVETDAGKRFPGVRIEEDNVSFFMAAGHEEPIARLVTKSGDRVFMTMFDQSLEGFDLVEKAEELSEYEEDTTSKYGGLVFPMVDLDQTVDISWLEGINTRDKTDAFWFVAQALQQTKVKMNEIGVRVQSAVAVGLMKAVMPNPDHIINRPFLMWITRKGLKKPLFVGYITEENWKNPGGLS
jgi:hypothetical protein